MGLAANQARLNLLTARKADLEYRLTTLSNNLQEIAVKEANAIAEKSRAYQEFVNQIATKENDQVVRFETTQAYVDYENEMAMLEVADNQLTQQQKKAETEHQAVVAEEEEIQKLVDNNIKNTFKLFQ